ncbi:MAG: hypothetical protein MIN69_12095 [Methylorubrum extorquens]|jgi:hypothetical protein|uniref:hypothetical protein n=1 Tax=Methylorubrum extorquens TaxID=408 RepID=UPI002FEE345C
MFADPPPTDIPDQILELRFDRNAAFGKSVLAWRRRRIEDGVHLEDWVEVRPYNEVGFWQLLHSKERATFPIRVILIELVISGITGLELEHHYNQSIQSRGILLEVRGSISYHTHDVDFEFSATGSKRSIQWKFIKETIERKPGRDADEVLSWLRKNDREAQFQCLYKHGEPTGRIALWAVLTTEIKAFDFKMRFG